MNLIKWADRDWAFGYDLGYLPLFIERLKCTPPRIDEIIKGASEEKLSEKVNDRWSVREHIGHLTDLEELHTGRIDDFINGEPVLRAADMTNKKTYDAHHNQFTTTSLSDTFRMARNHFLQRIKALDEKFFRVKALHPRLQQDVTLTDLLFFVAEHDTQHLAAISAILNP
jgi:uncharacterized damage-inducible protein DinB